MELSLDTEHGGRPSLVVLNRSRTEDVVWRHGQKLIGAASRMRSG